MTLLGIPKPYGFGAKVSETRKRLFQKGKLNLSGKNNPMYGKHPIAWNGDLTIKDPRVQKWRII